MKVVDYVLGRFTSEEIPDVNHSIEKRRMHVKSG